MDPQALASELRETRRALAAEMRANWQRDLPTGELLSDRWERARELGFGENASIYDSAHVLFDVEVGANTWIGPFVLLDGRGALRIGDWCAISTGVQIYTHDTVRRTLTGGRAEIETAAVTIGDCCHIGPGAIVLPGVTIGDHCVVGAASLVNRDLEPHTIAFGSPARKRGRVELDADGQVELVLDNPAR
jgi:acetyltransferase-like isoleucine patch superfamily enzyme